ncbi:autotransporter domain-containing protein [Bradyrhizobium tropiciagri]|uniref:autotransporter domain-containing protein n=1 Tax=Bradyrhizobium tropiciagri TaxID=312253 RepID=UPI001BA56543|nr:autotransporter domain-containing protein [Bradyrhizobium tropiciagri]MBR0872064.1 autotransporter domain-containing protein [Bradyrhizobium tropiciagri]
MAVSVVTPASAQDATWVGGSPSPANSDYLSGANWTPSIVPTGTATFGASPNSNISINSFTSVGGWTLNPGASNYGFTIGAFGGLTFTGTGITVNGGSASITNNLSLEFHNSSTAGAASITNNFSLLFYDHSSAGSASIINSGSVEFFNQSSPAGAAITNVGALANVHFEFSSGTANDHTLTVGSIAGSGTFSLGQNRLIVGSNNASTTVDGVIIDGLIPSGGSLEKVGTGTMTLAGANSYTGGTVISAGTIQATNADSMGSGTITLNGGTFQMAPTVSSVAFSNNVAVNAVGGTVDANGAQVNLQGVIADGAGAGMLRLIDSSASGFSSIQLSGNNTYTGGTTVVDTTVIVTNNRSVGTGTVTLDNSSFQAEGVGNLSFANNFKINSSAIGSAIDANGVQLTIAGNIGDGNGAGKLTVLDNSGGLGRVVLTGSSTYTGGTTICDCATLQLGDATHTASILGEIAVDGKLDIVNANTSGITKIVNDGFNGIATTTFYNSTTAGTATLDTKNFGITEFRDSSTAGNATVLTSDNALTIFRDTSSAGNAVFTTTNGGTVVFGDAFGPPGGSDTSTAAKAVIDNSNGGSAVFLGHTNAGEARITNRDFGATQFLEFSSAASANIVNTAGGTTFFFMNSTAANATIDNSGILYFGSGGFSATEAPTAGNATIVNRSGSLLGFGAFATAGNATITTESGGLVSFSDNATGGNAQFITSGTGVVDFGGSLGLNGDGRITAGSIAGSGTYYIGGGNTLAVGSNNLSTTVSGLIADFDPCGCGGPVGGSGTLQKVGSGTLTLSGANTYTGGTIITAGTIQVTNAGAVGTGAVTLDGGTFKAGGASNLTITNDFKINTTGGGIDNGGIVLTIAGGISNGNGGNGVLQLIDASGGRGTTVLAGINTYTGGTLVRGTTVQADNAGAISTGAVTLENAVFKSGSTIDVFFANNFAINGSANGSAIDANGVKLTIAGNISDGSGAGKLTVRDSSAGGTGAVALLGSNSYSGGTAISTGASLVLGDATHTAAIIGEVVNQGRFTIANANTSGITTLTNDGGRTTFLGTSTAGTMTIITTAGGATSFQDNSTGGAAQFITSGSGFVDFGGSRGLSGDGRISAGSIAGSGSYYIGAGNTLAVGGNNLSTSVSGVIADVNPCCGPGRAGALEKIGSGTLILAGTNTYSGGTIISAGTVQVTNGNSVGSGAVTLNGGTFKTDGASNLTFANAFKINTAGGVIDNNGTVLNLSGVISNGNGSTGSLQLANTGSAVGTTVLSAANTYTGATTVNGGILRVDGSIASSSLTTVNSGGLLTGTGTVGNTTIASGGILLPGIMPATPGSSLTVSGNLAFQSGALYLVAINSTASSLAKVSGSAALGGSVGIAIAAGSTVTKQYTILSAAGGRNGTFSGVDMTGAPSGLVATLGYDANNAYLNFALDYGRMNLNINQQNVATTLQNFFNANGGINATYTGLSPNGLTQASGEGATGAQQATFNAMGQFLGLLTDPFVAGRDGGIGGGAGATPFAEESAALAYAARNTDARDAFASIARKAPPLAPDFDQRWSVWAAGYGGSQNTSGNAVLGSNNTTSSVYGTAVGVDYRLSPNTLAGFALAGGGTSFSVNGLGWGRSDLFQAGAFLRHNIGPAYLSGALAYGWQDVTTDRIVTAAGVDHLRAEFNANAWSGRLEGGYRYATPLMGLTPYWAAQFTTFSLPNYVETVVSGGGAFALNYTAKSVTDTRSELGLRSDKSFAVEGGIVTLRGRVAWAHDFNPDRGVAAVFQALPGAAFVVNGAALARDSALTTASAEVRWRNGWSASATFEGEFSDVTQSYAGKGVMRYSW